MTNASVVVHSRDLLSRGEPTPVDPTQVPLWISGVTVSQYFQVATVSVLGYDLGKVFLGTRLECLTLDSGLRSVLCAQKRIPRKAVDFVYFANRFVGIFGAIAFLYGDYHPGISTDRAGTLTEPTQQIALIARILQSVSDKALGVKLIANETYVRSFCHMDKEYRPQDITCTHLPNEIEDILMIRVLALYCRAKSISICLNILFVMSASSKLGIIIYGLHSQQNAVFSLGNYGTVCGVNKTPSWKLGMFDWLIPMVYGAVLMIFALYKAAEYWRVSAGFKGFTLVKVLIKDQVLYFMLIILCSMFAILGFKLVIPNVILADILSSLGNPSFLSLLGSRMLINLKEAGERGQNEGTNYKIPSMTLSDIDFAEPRNDARAMDETTRNRDILT
ncbi:hypothetical protein A7U60_g5676 [Sanghuangporus baumii]|uniref:Uncharacterized protein n=1 Tax=Sanghuangporus baumii TaxID=108892 RepID=A0A9Q5HW82_SANBA|nr:hypothetical protein A7U60_g5676 [Sanghuangporus baumii]